ncbi:MAG: type II toxin-antitoxin system VapC family toxin [Anaerolineales bacterium]
MKYMLDTCICIEIIRHRSSSALTHLTGCQPGDVCLSSITLAELFHGAQKNLRPEQNLIAIQQFSLALQILDFDLRAASYYGVLCANLERQGLRIGQMDMLIGAHALSCGLVLVTNNLSEFQRISGLQIEDWSSPKN